ncbi:hypothetical protein BH09BAC5_BH09BAC5_19120 [soil metagenome]
MVAPKKIPFPFILDRLFPLSPITKPMFGCIAIYVKDKIVMVVRERENHPEVNGFWIATSKIYHDALHKEFPSMQSVSILTNGKGESNWQMIHCEADDFESSAFQICDLILKNDPRIGSVPKKKKKK